MKAKIISAIALSILLSCGNVFADNVKSDDSNLRRGSKSDDSLEEIFREFFNPALNTAEIGVKLYTVEDSIDHEGRTELKLNFLAEGVLINDENTDPNFIGGGFPFRIRLSQTVSDDENYSGTTIEEFTLSVLGGFDKFGNGMEVGGFSYRSTNALLRKLNPGEFYENQWEFHLLRARGNLKIPFTEKGSTNLILGGRFDLGTNLEIGAKVGLDHENTGIYFISEALRRDRKYYARQVSQETDLTTHSNENEINHELGWQINSKMAVVLFQNHVKVDGSYNRKNNVKDVNYEADADMTGLRFDWQFGGQ